MTIEVERTSISGVLLITLGEDTVAVSVTDAVKLGQILKDLFPNDID